MHLYLDRNHVISSQNDAFNDGWIKTILWLSVWKYIVPTPKWQPVKNLKIPINTSRDRDSENQQMPGIKRGEKKS